MKLLLDTHIALWLIGDPDRLTQATRGALDNADEVLVSAVAIWEIAIKHARRRGRASDIRLSGREARDAFATAGLGFLTVSPDHAASVDDLPRHHGDPFDRLMVAQAAVEAIRLVTADRELAAYGAMVMTV